MTDINQPENLLKEIGLTRSEAEFYLASLRLGPASAIQLGEHMGHTRQMIYNLLPSLVEKGLIKQSDINGRRLYEAINPEILADRAEKISHQIKELVPVLKSEQATSSAIPLITVYENPLAMRQWYRDFMKQAKNDDELLVWSSGKTQDWFEIDREFYEKYLSFSEKNGIKTFVILPDTKEAKEYQKTVGHKSTRAKFIEHGWETFAEKWIWKNQVCYLTIKGNATNMIVIESHELAEIERFDFLHIWQK